MLYLKYDRNAIERKMRNLENVRNPLGRTAQYLLCMVDHEGNYQAKSWHKVQPEEQEGYVIISVGGK